VNGTDIANMLASGEGLVSSLPDSLLKRQQIQQVCFHKFSGLLNVIVGARTEQLIHV
jgi:hypothetical protein